MLSFFVLTETWLGDDILNSELGFDSYNVFRTDRSVNTSKYTRGGGGVRILTENLKETGKNTLLK